MSFDLPSVLGGQYLSDEDAHTDSDGSMLPQGIALVALDIAHLMERGSGRQGRCPALQVRTLSCLARICRLATTNNRWNHQRQTICPPGPIDTSLCTGWKVSPPDRTCVGGEGVPLYRMEERVTARQYSTIFVLTVEGRKGCPRRSSMRRESSRSGYGDQRGLCSQDSLPVTGANPGAAGWMHRLVRGWLGQTDFHLPNPVGRRET